MLLQAPIDITRLATVVTTGIFTLENVDVNRHDKKGQGVPGLELVAPHERQKYEILIAHEFTFDKPKCYKPTKYTKAKRAKKLA